MKNTFDGFLQNSPPIIMGGVLMFRSERMRRTGARSTASGTSSHMQSWADCITGTLESSFWKRQGIRTLSYSRIYSGRSNPEHAFAAADSDFFLALNQHPLNVECACAKTSHLDHSMGASQVGRQECRGGESLDQNECSGNRERGKRKREE